MSDLTVVNMWCGPRTVSTALMYSWRERADTAVFDEPFYGLYLREHDPGHPGRDEILEAMPLGYEDVLALIREPGSASVRFVKNIGHHLDAVPAAVLDEFTNAVLIRDPTRVIASLDATLHAEIPMAITGLRQQAAIVEHELAAGRQPIVIDAQALLADPAGALAALCGSVGIEADPAMLGWPAGPKPEDGVWARHWYTSAHRSTGFGPPSHQPIALDGPHRDLAERCRPVYEELLAHHLDW